MAKKRILLIDNDKTIVVLLKTILSTRGYDTQVALNGKEALDILNRDTNFNLIILDLMMPSVNGWQVMQFLKSNKDLKSLPVMIMSAKADDESIRKGLTEEQADDYIIKPFDVDEFVSRIKSITG